MSKVIETIDYWEEFFKTYPNPEPFIDFVSQDESLLKIFNFTSNPDISLIKHYPFEGKIVEAQSISPKDIERLTDLYIEAGEDPEREKEAHWLGYLISLYRLVGTTLRFYSMWKKDGTISQSEIIDFISIHFRRHLAIDKTYIIEDTEGDQIAKTVIGRIDPFRRLIFINDNVLQVHFLLEPIENEIEETKNELDIKSVINFQRYRPVGPVFDEICFSGGSDKFQVEFYFKDKMLDEFSYPIHKRYEKLVDKGVKSLTMIDREKDMEIAPWEFVYSFLSNISLSYDSSEGVRPAGYFKRCFEYLKREYYRKGATTSLPVGIELDKAIEDKKGSETSRHDQHDQFDAEQKQNIPKEQLKSKQTEIELDELCKDEMDKRIIVLLKDKAGRFKDSGKINYSAIAKELDTYPNDIRRRYEEFLKRVKKQPYFKDFFKK